MEEKQPNEKKKRERNKWQESKWKEQMIIEIGKNKIRDEQKNEREQK